MPATTAVQQRDNDHATRGGLTAADVLAVAILWEAWITAPAD